MPTSSPVRIPALYCIYSNRPGKSLWHISGMGYLSADLSRYPNCRRDLVVTVFEEAGNKPVVDEFVNYFCKYFEKDPSGMGDVTV